MNLLKSLMSWKRLLTAAPLPLVALVTAGWTQPLRPPTEGLDHATLASDARYMGQRFKEQVVQGEAEHVRIDLADPAQHRFVMNRLRASGKTARNAPELFERLRQVKLRHEAWAARAQHGEAESPAALTANNWGCDHYMLLSGSTSSGTQSYVSGPVGTCLNGASYVYLDVQASHSDPAETNVVYLASNAGEEYAAGTAFDSVYVTPQTPSLPGRLYIADSMMIAMNESTGEEVITYSRGTTHASGVQPSIGAVNRLQSALAAVTATVTHPRNAPGINNPFVTSCQLRGGTDCDYAMVKLQGGTLQPYVYPPSGLALRKDTSGPNGWTGDSTNGNYFEFPQGVTYNSTQIYVPIELQFDAGSVTTDCRIVSGGPSTRARLIKRVGGLACTTIATTLGDEVTKLSGVRSGPIRRLVDMPWRTSLPGSTTPNNCDSTIIANDSPGFTVTISALANCGAGEVYRTTTYPSMTTTKTMYILNSCMAEGTSIVRADGASVPVESLKKGDRVVANERGVVLTVTDVAHGREDKPLVRLLDSQGHDVSLTQQHPVVLASGAVVAAGDVKVQDRVRTQAGVATIATVERLPYEGKVYNLTLGTPEELARVGKMDRTMFADGILVGDNAMQTELGRGAQQPRYVLTSLPKVWHRDFRSRPHFSR